MRAPLTALFLLSLLPAPVSDAAPLTRLAEVRRLSFAEVQAAPPVRVRGIVLWSLPREGGAFVLWDGEEAIYAIGSDRVDPALVAGDEVLVEGHAAGPGYAPNLEVQRIERLGRAPLPEPRRLRPSELLADRHDCAYVEVTGRVQAARSAHPGSKSHWRLVLWAEGVRVNLLCPPAPAEEVQRLLGAEVVARGICLHGFDAGRRMVNGQLQLHSLEDVRVLQPPPAEEAVPLLPISEVLRFRQGSDHGGPVRTRGTVVCVHPGEWLQLHEGESGLRVQSAQDPAPLVGDLVEAWGYPEPGNTGPVLTDARLTKLGRGRLPEPLRTTVRGALEQNGRLVRLDATLVETPGQADGARLLLRADDLVFTASLAGPRPASWSGLAAGSRLGVTGLCQVSAYASSLAAGYPVAQSFSLHLRSSDDVQLLATAPWWNSRRLTVALSVLAGALGLSALWALAVGRKNARLHRAESALREARDALARRVEVRTDQLQEQIRARLEQRAAFTAVAAERTRMARDLHDSLQQRLASAALRLDNVRRSLPCENGATRELAALTTLLREGQDEVRRSVWDLRAAALDRHTLAEAMRESLRLLLESTGIRGEVHIEGVPRELPAAAENHLLRIVQEAAGNVLAHAHASELHLTLVFEPTVVRLSVEDDGVGFTPSPPGVGDTGHYGLADMRERARALGGTLVFESAPGLGTTVLLTAPV